MGTLRRHDSIQSVIRYHDYVAFLCYTDAEWSRRRVPVDQTEGPEFFIRGVRRLVSTCCEYGWGISGNFEMFLKAGFDGPDTPLAAYLFNPVCLSPFGHADDLAVVLLDDFDPVQDLTSDLRTTVEEVCLAFCPRADSLGVEGIGETVCDLDVVFGDKPRSPHRESEGIWSPVEHAFQTSMPLAVFTKCKMDGLASVGQGLLFQQALFRAMALKIRQVMDILRGRVSPSTDRDLAVLISKEDLSATKCVFLDLQGPEEIGILTFCSNYSVAMTLVAAIRSLTFGQVFDADPSGHLKQILGQSKAHQAAVYLGWQERGQHPVSDIEMLRNNHVFLWTRSSLSVSPWTLARGDYSHCRGFVEASAQFQISPGHRLRVEEGAIGWPEELVCGAKAGMPSRGTYFRCHAGTADLVLSYGTSPTETAGPLLGLPDVLQIVRNNLRTFGQKTENGDTGRDVIDISTYMSIPVPRIAETTAMVVGEVIEPHFSPLSVMLPELQKRLCFLTDPGNERLQAYLSRKPGTRPGRLDFGELRRSFRRVGSPVTLWRTIEYLYLNFATLLADPFLFESVLDMYDMFATLHRVLTDDLPRARTEELGLPKGMCVDGLDTSRVDQIARIVEAIHNAVTHRVLKAHPESPIRDMAIDFRGGLNQVLLAGDAPLKCGLGVFRRYIYGPEAGVARDTVGAVTRIGFGPGARSFSGSFGTQAKLACLDVDVPHVLHVASFVDYLHESFHLIFEALRKQKRGKGGMFGVDDERMVERLEEVFALLLCRLFLFGPDDDTFLYFFAAKYSAGSEGGASDGPYALERFVEKLLLRLFLCLQAVPLECAGKSAVAKCAKRDGLEEASEEFMNLAERVGPFFWAHARLVDENERERIAAFREFCRHKLREVYPQVARYLPEMRDEVLAVYNHFFPTKRCRPDGRFKGMTEEIGPQVREALRSGRPLIRGLYRNARCRTTRKSAVKRWKDIEDVGLDPLVLLCGVLAEYARTINKAINKAVVIYRDPQTGRVAYHRKKRPWNPFQIDPGRTTMFCPVPAARRERIRRQITVLKTCWDIASTLRARRLWLMLRDNFPELREAKITR